MIPFEEAYQIVINNALPIGSEQVTIFNALHKILTEDIVSDIDMPPFNKSAMDGYACRKEDIENELTVIETIPAGYVPKEKINKNQCSKIMTGAMIPEGADCVVMVEDTAILTQNTIRYTGKNTKENICFKGEDIRKGDVVLKKGTKIMPQHLAILAAVGCTKPTVSIQPKVGIISTGNELVEPMKKPSISQIRNSNSYQLYAQVKSAGGTPTYYGIAKDTEESIELLLKKAMNENDVILISGGVSMGEYDFVPDILKRNNFKILFDKIAIKPGKPTIFGISDAAACFGLPGNPVSTFIIFELLVKPFLFKMMQYNYKIVNIPMRLGKTISRRETDRMLIVPVVILEEGIIAPLEYHGSAHINAYTEANGIITIPKDISEIKEGTIVNVRQI